MADKRSQSPEEENRNNQKSVKRPRTANRKQEFLPEYTEQFPFIIKPSRIGIHYAHCTTCCSDFSIAASGLYDITVHVNGTRHKNRSEIVQGQPSMANFCKKQMKDAEHTTISAEMLFTNFLVEHNISLTAADHFTKLLPKLCPDSTVAQNYACGRTKTTALIHHLSQEKTGSIVKNIKDSPFALASDGSNSGSDKFYPIVISYVNQYGDIKCHLLDVPTVDESSCTGLNIYKAINNKLCEYGLSWKKCLAFGADNANVMSGSKWGVVGLIQKDYQHVFFAGCPCHLIHLGAKYASECISTDVAARLVDIFWYLKHSAKRQNELTELKEKHGLQDLKVLKYCPTRWLSLYQCISRLMTLWGPLKEFFVAEGRSTPTTKDVKENDSKSQSERQQRCAEFLKSHTARAMCLFLEYILPLFTKHNQALQYDKPEIHKSRRIMTELYKELLLKFLKPSAFSSGSIHDINPLLGYYQKSDDYLSVGSKCRKFMREKKFKESKIRRIMEECRAFYQKAATYLKKKLPMGDPLLKNAEVFDLSLLPTLSFNSVKFFTDKYPFLLEGTNLDQLESEFLNLQIEALPEHILSDRDAGKQWTSVGHIKDHTGNSKYNKIANLAKYVLCIPHSNAACERVFSHVKHIRSDARSSMKKSTLSALCVLKESDDHCYEKEYNKTQTKKAKSATTNFLHPEQ